MSTLINTSDLQCSQHNCPSCCCGKLTPFINCFSNRLSHHIPEHLQGVSAEIFCNCTEGMSTIPHFVRSLVTMTYIILILIHSFSEHLCLVDWGEVALEKTTPIRRQMGYV